MQQNLHTFSLKSKLLRNGYFDRAVCAVMHKSDFKILKFALTTKMKVDGIKDLSNYINNVMIAVKNIR